MQLRRGRKGRFDPVIGTLAADLRPGAAAHADNCLRQPRHTHHSVNARPAAYSAPKMCLL